LGSEGTKEKLEGQAMEAITVIIPTYNRLEILGGTIDYLDKNLKYGGGIHILIGNDGELVPSKWFGRNTTCIDSPKKGLGANLNMLLQKAETDIVLQMDDDHHLVKPLDINQFVKDLIEFKNNTGWIRIFLGTEEDLNNDDPFYQFSAKMQGRYWIPAPGVDELYIPSNRPHLKRRDFHAYYGLYKENLKLGETETEFCHRYADLHLKGWGDRDHSHVVIPVAAPSFDTWQHVGESYQKRGH
jgi:glycosyltransferase involved in cell wall biosynthesis